MRRDGRWSGPSLTTHARQKTIDGNPEHPAVLQIEGPRVPVFGRASSLVQFSNAADALTKSFQRDAARPDVGREASQEGCFRRRTDEPLRRAIALAVMAAHRQTGVVVARQVCPLDVRRRREAGSGKGRFEGGPTLL